MKQLEGGCFSSLGFVKLECSRELPSSALTLLLKFSRQIPIFLPPQKKEAFIFYSQPLSPFSNFQDFSPQFFTWVQTIFAQDPVTNYVLARAPLA
jgi:hypothetical protein